MAASPIDFIAFIFFIWISYFQIHTTVALRRLVSLASCVPLKVRYEEIVKAINKSLRRLKHGYSGLSWIQRLGSLYGGK